MRNVNSERNSLKKLSNKTVITGITGIRITKKVNVISVIVNQGTESNIPKQLNRQKRSPNVTLLKIIMTISEKQGLNQPTG